jgi:hypothetical protein
MAGAPTASMSAAPLPGERRDLEQIGPVSRVTMQCADVRAGFDTKVRFAGTTERDTHDPTGQ